MRIRSTPVRVSRSSTFATTPCVPLWALVPEEGGDPLVPAEVYADGCSIQIPRCQDWPAPHARGWRT
jgi:hypothetical protein